MQKHRRRMRALPQECAAAPSASAARRRGPTSIADFDEIDAELACSRLSGIASRPSCGRRCTSAKRWAPVAVALLLSSVCCSTASARRRRCRPRSCCGRPLPRPTAHPEKPRRIQIRTRDAPADAVGQRARSRRCRSELRTLEVMFRAAHYDWDDPLSAKSYQAWRDQLAEKQDEVLKTGLRYVSGHAAVRANWRRPRSRFDRQDLQPVEERFEFRNREWVEITELRRRRPAPPPDSVQLPARRPAAGNSNTHDRSRRRPDRRTSRSDCRRRAARAGRAASSGRRFGRPDRGLARRRRDSGEREWESRPQRQQEISDALRSQTHVVVRFSESARGDGARPDNRASAPDSARPRISQQLQARMAKQIGGRANFAQLAAQVLDLSEPMMSRAYALRRLAEQFPVGAGAELRRQDRQVSEAPAAGARDALRRQTAELIACCGRLLGVSGATRRPRARLRPAPGSCRPKSCSNRRAAWRSCWL